MEKPQIIQTASSLEEVQQLIDRNILKGNVLWDEKSNRIRSECLDGMTYTFNYLPALAKKTIHPAFAHEVQHFDIF